MLALIMKIALALAAGYIISYFFPTRLQAIEKAVITLGSGISILILATFFLFGFKGIMEIRENLTLVILIAIIAFSVQIYRSIGEFK